MSGKVVAFFCKVIIMHAVIDAQGLIKSAASITYFTNGIKYGYDKQCAREPIAVIL